MTRRHVGLVTFFDNATRPNFIMVWCGAHQLDLFMTQGMTTLVSQQVIELFNLSHTFWELVGGKVALPQSKLQAMAEATADYAALQLMSITVERNSANEQAFANDQLPPVMPHELVKYMQSQFYAIVRKHILQLQAAKFTPQQIEDIEEEHGKLIRCYHAEENLKLAINVCDHKASLRSNPALQQWKQISPG
ncbi:hypothetical protein AXG93_4510s1060 [Marchantia polymorpha subsp. ruderalis]|uniref:Uncharacterized protein n=1 Tax=Marchantia polymorpha subsp. ruderalis TaxID=1480154 RepID=A0A176WG64_MARPO|nr:hypothetical protein AXG93_4510s1060 [Marchantia polymorpha subsp. ruderalis]